MAAEPPFGPLRRWLLYTHRAHDLACSIGLDRGRELTSLHATTGRKARAEMRDGKPVGSHKICDVDGGTALPMLGANR
jgi:hypothetical protein